MRYLQAPKWLGLPLAFCMAAQTVAGEADKSLSLHVAKSVENGVITYYEPEPRTITYSRNGTYDAKGLADVNETLRDRDVEGPARAIDPALVELLHRLKQQIEKSRPGFTVTFGVISGDRTPATNEGLRHDASYPYRGDVAANSQHTHSRAADIFIVGLPRGELLKTAWCSTNASVGFYPHIDFPEDYIHIDSRPERRAHWGFTPPKCD